MPTYRVVRKSDRKTVYAYTADAPIEFPELPFVDYDHVVEVAINQDGSINESQGRRITRLAFRNRFTLMEKAAIEMAALDNPQAPVEQRQMAAMLRAFMGDVDAATFVDLDNSATRAGVMQLEQVGLLAQGRAAEILDTLPAADEVYTG